MRNNRTNLAGRRLYLPFLLLGGAFAAAGCAPTGLHVRVPSGVAVPDRCAVMFFVDGLDRAVYDDMLARRELPAIEKYIVRRGVSVDDPVTCIPSITYAIGTTFLTGLYPGHHDIVGNNWFDRRSLIVRSYMESSTYREVNADFTAPTIYDVLGDRFTVNFQNAVRRGVKRTIDNWVESGVCWFFGWHLAADRWVGSDFEQVAGLARQAGRWPDFIQAYFPGVDARGHHVGADHPLYRQAVRNVDTQIGWACEALLRAGIFDRTYLILVTDHGHAPCAHEHYIELARWLARAKGWRIHEDRYDWGTLPQRQRHFAKVDAVALNGGSRQFKLYLPGADGWASRPDFERCKEVLTSGRPSLGTLPAVFVGACRKGPDQVWLYGRSGDATVTRRRIAGEHSRPDRVEPNPRDNEIEYRYDVGTGDPLGYLSEPDTAEFVRQGWHGSRAWLTATTGSRCPDTPAQIVELFDSPRAPDIEIFAAEDWDFSHENVGGHGSILRRDMRIVMVFAGPGLPAGRRIATARAVDLAPTIVELLAGPDRLNEMGHLDGMSLVPPLRGAEAIMRMQ